jgi:hypothetical protein
MKSSRDVSSSGRSAAASFLAPSPAAVVLRKEWKSVFRFVPFLSQSVIIVWHKGSNSETYFASAAFRAFLKGENSASFQMSTLPLSGAAKQMQSGESAAPAS